MGTKLRNRTSYRKWPKGSEGLRRENHLRRMSLLCWSMVGVPGSHPCGQPDPVPARPLGRRLQHRALASWTVQGAWLGPVASGVNCRQAACAGWAWPVVDAQEAQLPSSWLRENHIEGVSSAVSGAIPRPFPEPFPARATNPERETVAWKHLP